MNLVSNNQIDDIVLVDFGTAGKVVGYVKAVSFTENSVYYDVTLTGTIEGEDFQSTIYDVRAVFVHPYIEELVN